MGKKNKGQRKQKAESGDSNKQSENLPNVELKDENPKKREQKTKWKQFNPQDLQPDVKHGDAERQTYSQSGQQRKHDHQRAGPSQSQFGAIPKQYPQERPQMEREDIASTQPVGAWGKPKSRKEPNKQSTPACARESQNRGHHHQQQQSSTPVKTQLNPVGSPQIMHIPKEVPQSKAVIQKVSSSEKPQPSVDSKQSTNVAQEGVEEDISDLISPLSVSDRKGGTECMFKTNVIVNYFPMNLNELTEALHYDVAIEPDKPKKALPRVMEAFRKSKFPNRYPAFDGSKSLYSSSALFDLNVADEMSDTVTVIVDGAQKKYKVTIKLAARLDLTCFRNYMQYVSENILECNKPSSPLQCVNVILSNIPSLSYVRIGRSYFTPPEVEFKLGDGCVLYRGFSQSAILRWKPFLNVDVANKAFTVSISMLNLLKEMFPKFEPIRGLQKWDCDAFAAYIKGLKIEYQVGHAKRTWIVNGLSFSARDAKFETKTGKPTTVEQYFKDEKNLTLKYPNLPTLWVGNPSRKILVPLECCTLLPGQSVTRNMTNKQVKKMLDEVSKSTTERLDTINKCVQQTKYNQNPIMQEFKLSIDTTLQEVEARILKSPELQYKHDMMKVTNGVWGYGKFTHSEPLTRWSILCLDDYKDDRELQDMGKRFAQVGPQLAIKIDLPSPAFKRLGRNDSLRDYFKENRHLQLILVILNRKPECYKEVKKASEIYEGSLTQCIMPTTRISAVTVKNILLKMNAKLNGENHRIQDLPNFLRKPCMIMGADVTHPGSSNFPSIAAVTASYDVNFFKYTFNWRLQPPRQEMIEDLKTITMQRLRCYYAQNRAKPQTIFYIRDGVSEGQFIDVLKIELNAIRAACKELGKSEPYEPAIVFIVVQKRHRTRFFPKDLNVCNDKKNYNVPAGTCIDTVITHPSLVDFYLVSHATTRGVARPTKYVKLWDDVRLSEDEFEKFIYYLCHMYARCNRSVSYPAPTYYAHLAAARCKAYCDKNINTDQLEREQDKLKIQEELVKNSPMFFV